jgi:hypothetical protein
MKDVKHFLVILAFLGINISSAWAQTTTYNISNRNLGGYLVRSSDRGNSQNVNSLQEAIDFIRNDAAGAACIIQLGAGRNAELNMGASDKTTIIFDGDNTPGWGKITLTGNATTASTVTDLGVIRLENGVSIDCKAEITATNDCLLIYNNSGNFLSAITASYPCFYGV